MITSAAVTLLYFFAYISAHAGQAFFILFCCGTEDKQSKQLFCCIRTKPQALTVFSQFSNPASVSTEKASYKHQPPFYYKYITASQNDQGMALQRILLQSYGEHYGLKER